MKLIIHAEADAEFAEAYAWYASEGEHLAREFADEITATIGRILQAPERWPIVEGVFRRCTAKRFPYGVIYRVAGDAVSVVSFMHLRRRPGYWRKRA